VTILGTCEYVVGRKMMVLRSMLVNHTVRRVRQGGCRPSSRAVDIANRLFHLINRHAHLPITHLPKRHLRPNAQDAHNANQLNAANSNARVRL
jgi:hypothetical protein